MMLIEIINIDGSLLRVRARRQMLAPGHHHCRLMLSRRQRRHRRHARTRRADHAATPRQSP